MSKLLYSAVGALVGAMATSAVFLSLSSPTSAPTTEPAPSPAADVVPVQPLSETEQAEEDRFLELRLGAEDAPKVEPLKDAGNVRYSDCQKAPELVAWLGKPGNATFARRRDMNDYLVTTNVLATKDCTCTGKMISVDALRSFEARLMEVAKVAKVEDLVTHPMRDEARVMRWQVEDLCGGRL